jgi:hypothetical protein
MEDLTLTQEQIERSVSAAYDSVNLINELKALPELDAEQQATLDRNIEHIRIMMGMEFFVEALTTEQITELQAI